MAMYYYASKLNEASCSGCHLKVPPAPSEPAPLPPPPIDHAPLPPDTALLHGSALSYYDNDYYSMVRRNKLMTENNCKHIVMNGGINYVHLPGKTGEKQPSKPMVAYPESVPEKSEVEFKDGQIISATLDALIDMLRPGASKDFTFTFLLCSRLFIRPHELLSKLCKRYFKCYEQVGTTEARDLAEKELADMVALVKLLKQWTSTFPYDFRDDRVMALVRNITQRCAAEHMASIREEVSLMLQNLLEKLTALEHYEETLIAIPQVSTVDQLSQGDILMLGLTPTELANQLTAVELHRLSFVGPEEFVQTFAPSHMSQSAPTYSSHHVEAKSIRNLAAYADWFNRLSYLVATDVLKAYKSKYRARVLEQWVMTARECFNVGNFNSLMAIISALNMVPITRLRKTWNRTSGVCGQQLRQLELCVEPSGNHARYRAALAAAPTDTAVPLLSVTCRDLHFANQSAPTKLPGNRINFEKCAMLSRHVNTQLASRRLTSEDTSVSVPSAPHPPVWRYLNDRPTLSEIALERISFEREPPADHNEKERYKRLRGAPGTN